MATLYSNELKAVVLQEDFLENPLNVMKEKCQTVQHFDYCGEYRRNETGNLYGKSETTLLTFTVRVNSMGQANSYFRSLASNDHFRFSFIFNATFNDNQRLASYDDGMVVDGFIVNIDEVSSVKIADKGEASQPLLTIKLLVRSVTYLGNDHDLKCTFIQ